MAARAERPRAEGDRALLAQGFIELANALGTMAARAGFAYEHYRHAGEAPMAADGGVPLTSDLWHRAAPPPSIARERMGVAEAVMAMKITTEA